MSAWMSGRLSALIGELGFRRASAHIASVFGRQVVGYLYHGLLMPPGAFSFEGELYRYKSHWHNLTWQNERAVEIPIVQEALRRATLQSGHILEVGNVLSHYGRVHHDVLDKYEQAPRLIRADVLDFQTDRPYDLIVSISTLEHVGWDEQPRDPAKFERAVLHLRTLLAPRGRLFATVPMGYNSHVDELFIEGRAPFEQIGYLRRELTRNHWAEAAQTEIRSALDQTGRRSLNMIAVCRAGSLPA
jgi:hypothetical protein